MELRDGLKARLDTIAGLVAHDVIPQVVVPPCAIIVPRRGSFEETMGRGGDPARYFFEIWLFAPSGDFPSGQNILDRYLAATSTGGVFGAIAADRTLGGRAITAFVDGYREYEVRDYSNIQVLTTTVDVEVWSS